jgi:two-component system, NtrC family, sensor kinase
MKLGTLSSHLIMRRPYWVVLVLLWAGLVTLSYLWNVGTVEAYAERMAAFRGRLVFEVLQASRVWEEGHGSEAIRPALDSSGKPSASAYSEQFNPAAMARQVDAMLARETDMRVRLTSLNPLNPDNSPEDWERLALASFEHGVPEYLDHVVGAVQQQYRYMAPLRTQDSCLACHADQGYKTGDIRGAMSITQDAAYIFKSVSAQFDNLRSLHLGAFLLLATLTWGSLSLIRRHILTIETERDRRRQMADSLARKIDELKQTQGELLQSEKQASLGRMVAGFAHEVNTPVGVAVGAASHAQEAHAEIERLLGSEEVSEDDLRRQLAIIGESSALTLSNLKRAAALVQSFKRTSVDQISEHDRDYVMAELIDDVRRSLHNVFKRTHIDIQVDCPDSLRLHGPAGTVEQILTNLLMNSYHHAYDDGTRPGRIEIAARMASADHVELYFADDGAGMPAEALAQIFEPFFTTRRGQGGSGLGLYIVHSLATVKLGGTIVCSSEPGKGTRFNLTYPGQRTARLGNEP